MWSITRAVLGPSSSRQRRCPMRDLRILCLHGCHGSAMILRRQMEPLAAALPASVEFVYVNAPSLATGDFGWWHGGFHGWGRAGQGGAGRVRGGSPCGGFLGFFSG